MQRLLEHKENIGPPHESACGHRAGKTGEHRARDPIGPQHPDEERARECREPPHGLGSPDVAGQTPQQRRQPQRKHPTIAEVGPSKKTTGQQRRTQRESEPVSPVSLGYFPTGKHSVTHEHPYNRHRGAQTKGRCPPTEGTHRFEKMDAAKSHQPVRPRSKSTKLGQIRDQIDPHHGQRQHRDTEATTDLAHVTPCQQHKTGNPGIKF